MFPGVHKTSLEFIKILLEFTELPWSSWILFGVLEFSWKFAGVHRTFLKLLDVPWSS